MIVTEKNISEKQLNDLYRKLFALIFGNPKIAQVIAKCESEPKVTKEQDDLFYNYDEKQGSITEIIAEINKANEANDNNIKIYNPIILKV